MATPPDALDLPLLLKRFKRHGNRGTRIQRRKVEQLLGITHAEIDRAGIAVGRSCRKAELTDSVGENPEDREA